MLTAMMHSGRREMMFGSCSFNRKDMGRVVLSFVVDWDTTWTGKATGQTSAGWKHKKSLHCFPPKLAHGTVLAERSPGQHLLAYSGRFA
jgi:hypothetical protein